MPSPRVSVGLPVFNGENFLSSSLETLVAQDFEDLEIIIADNASTDRTEEICREFARKDPRVLYHRNASNIGASGNYNKTFSLARGTYFKWAAHDDECHPAMIRRCVNFLDEAPDSVTMVYPLAELIDHAGKTLASPLDRIASAHVQPHRRVSHLLWCLNMCDPIFGLFRSDYLRQTQLIGPFFGADYVVLAELAMMGEICELPEVLFRLRAHEKRSMGANKSVRERTAWYSPAAAKKKIVLPDWEQMVIQLVKSVQRTSLTPRQKVLCTGAVLSTHYWRRFKDAGGLVKRRMKRMIQSRLEKSPASESAEPR